MSEREGPGRRDFSLDEPGPPEATNDLPPSDDGVRDIATDPPAVAPSAMAEQPVIAAGIGLSGFAQADPEGGLTGSVDDYEGERLDPQGSTSTDDQAGG